MEDYNVVSENEVPTTETTLQETVTLDVTEQLSNSIKLYQFKFAELNNQLEALIKGYIVGKDVEVDKYQAAFNTELTQITLTLKPEPVPTEEAVN